MTSQINLAVEKISRIAPEVKLTERFPSRVLTNRWGSIFGSDSGLLLRKGFLDFLDKSFVTLERKIDIAYLSYSLPGYPIFSWLEQKVRATESWDEQLHLINKISETHMMNYGQIGVIAWHPELEWILVEDMAADFTVFACKNGDSKTVKKFIESGYFFTRKHVENQLLLGCNDDVHLPMSDEFLMLYMHNYEEIA